jgi:hypothetical protein
MHIQFNEGFKVYTKKGPQPTIQITIPVIILLTNLISWRIKQRENEMITSQLQQNIYCKKYSTYLNTQQWDHNHLNKHSCYYPPYKLKIMKDKQKRKSNNHN